MPEHNYHHGDLKNALIQAGVDILAREGTGGLSLRKVARLAGVSHSAPYAHFRDKQALIAAISSEGFRRLYKELESASQSVHDDPKLLLIESGRAYIRFAMREPDIFKIMFSGIIEKEKEYPDFVGISQSTFTLLVGIVNICQQGNILRPGPTELLAVALWGQLHGIVSLTLEKQISHTLLEHYEMDEILLFALNQFSLVELKL